MKTKILSLLLVFTMASSSFALSSTFQEVVRATSGWFATWGDARSDCNEKLEAQGGRTSGEIQYYDEAESADEMGKKTYKVSCKCYKEETNNTGLN